MFNLWVRSGRRTRNIQRTTAVPTLATVAKTLDALRLQSTEAIDEVKAFVDKVSQPRSFFKLFSLEKLTYWVQVLTVRTTDARDNPGGLRDLVVNPDLAPIGSLRTYNVVNEMSMYVEYMVSCVASEKKAASFWGRRIDGRACRLPQHCRGPNARTWLRPALTSCLPFSSFFTRRSEEKPIYTA